MTVISVPWHRLRAAREQRLVEVKPVHRTEILRAQADAPMGLRRGVVVVLGDLAERTMGSATAPPPCSVGRDQTLLGVDRVVAMAVVTSTRIAAMERGSRTR